MTRWIRAAVYGAVVFVLTAAPAPAQNNDRRLPVPAVPVQMPDGATASLAQLGAAGKWLVVCVTPASTASGRFFDALEQWQIDPQGRLVVIVVTDTPADGSAFITRNAARLPGVRWVLSTDRGVWTALQLKGVPTLVGALDGLIDWKIAGVLNDPKTLESVVRSWLDR